MSLFERNQRMKGIRQFLLTATLFIILFCYAMFQGGFVSWFLFFSYLIIFIYHLLFMMYPLKKWEISRTTDKSVIYAGDELELVINIQRKIPFPLPFCVVEEVVPDSLQKRIYPFYISETPVHNGRLAPFKKIVFPWFKREINIQFTMDHVPRGEHHLKQIQIKTYDLFGFMSKEHQFEIDMMLKVYPRRVKMMVGKYMTGIEQGDISTPALHYRNAHVASGIREYASGDKLSWINWKQTARKNKLMTKEFEQEKNTDTLLVLDRSIEGAKSEFVFEGAVEVILGLTEALYHKSTNIGLLSMGDELVDIPLYDQPNKIQMIRDYCMKVQPTRGKRYFQQLKEQLKQYRQDCVVIIVTTRLNPAFVQTLLSLKHRSRQMMVIFIQQSSQLGPNTEELIKALKQEKIITSILTEREFQKPVIEVNV